jgi:hypothetical protein
MVARAAVASLKEPHDLSPRIRRLRDHYFEGVRRPWNNEFTCWTTGTPWDVVYDETSYYIVPEAYAFLQTFGSSALQAARPVPLPLPSPTGRASPPRCRTLAARSTLNRWPVVLRGPAGHLLIT